MRYRFLDCIGIISDTYKLVKRYVLYRGNCMMIILKIWYRLSYFGQLFTLYQKTLNCSAGVHVFLQAPWVEFLCKII